MTKLMITNFLALLLVVSCTETPAPVNSGSNSTQIITDTGDGSGDSGNSGDSGAGGTGNSGSGGTGTTPGSGSTCYGSSSDGQGNGTPIHYFDMRMAGHQTWKPGSYPNNFPSGNYYKPPTIQDALYIFKSDSRLRVRFKVKSQPHPTAGQEYCYGRVTGQPGDAKTYTKLRFRVALRDIICDSPDPYNTNNCLSGFRLSDVPYAVHEFSPQDVNSCSPIIDFGPMRNLTQYGTVVVVDDVKTDSTCQKNSTQCPAEQIVRQASCWDMKMQVVTDSTQDFK